MNPYILRAKSSIQTNWVPTLLIGFVLFGLGAISLLHGMPMSPFDEWVYLDYLFKIPSQFIVHKGEFLGQDALGIMACFGEIPFGPMGETCSSSYSPSLFPYGGITSADPYSPLYFYATWIMGHMFQWIPGINLVMGWRLAGLLWLSAGILAFYKLGLMWRVPKASIFTAGILIIASPYAYWTFTYVSTDAPSFVCGALLLILATKLVKGESKGYLFIAFSIVATLIKVTNILSVFAAALFILVASILKLRKSSLSQKVNQSAPSMLRSFIIVVFAACGSIAIQLLWTQVSRMLAVSNNSIDQGISTELTWYKFLELTSLGVNSLTMTIPVNGLPGLNSLPLPTYAVSPLSWIIIAGVVSAFWAKTKRIEKRAMIISGTIAVFAFGGLLALMLQISTNSYFDLPPRYMGPLLPIIALLVSFGVKDRVARTVLNSYGIALIACLIVASAIISQADLTT